MGGVMAQDMKLQERGRRTLQTKRLEAHISRHFWERAAGGCVGLTLEGLGQGHEPDLEGVPRGRRSHVEG